MQKRNIVNEVEEYNRLFENPNKNAFYTDDIDGVYQMSKDSIFYLIVNALKLGYMRGYKRAKRDLGA